jgi:hypothetical protein
MGLYSRIKIPDIGKTIPKQENIFEPKRQQLLPTVHFLPEVEGSGG